MKRHDLPMKLQVRFCNEMKHLNKNVLFTSSAGAQIFTLSYLQIYIWCVFRYGMVSLGKYVVNCWFPSGSKALAFRSKRGQRYSSVDNCVDEKGKTEQILLNDDELCQAHKTLYCQQKKYRKDHFNTHYNNSTNKLEAKKKETKTANDGDECYCRNSEIQFGRSSTVEDISRLGGRQDEENSKNESYDIGCGIVSYLKKLFSCNESGSNNEPTSDTKRTKHYSCGIFDFLENPYSTSINTKSKEENDKQQIFSISTERDKQNNLPEKRNRAHFSKTSYHRGCDNISFETESSPMQNRKKVKTPKLVDRIKRNRDKSQQGVSSSTNFISSNVTFPSKNRSLSEICTITPVQLL
jgi:hypothetical protein